MKASAIGIMLLTSLFCLAGSVTPNMRVKVVRGGQQEYDEYHSGVDIGSVHTSGNSVPTKYCWLHVSDGKTLYNVNMKKEGIFARDCPDFQIGQVLAAYYEGGKHWKEIWLIYPDRKGERRAYRWTVVEKGNAETMQ